MLSELAQRFFLLSQRNNSIFERIRKDPCLNTMHARLAIDQVAIRGDFGRLIGELKTEGERMKREKGREKTKVG